jgi:hypothetical protein
LERWEDWHGLCSIDNAHKASAIKEGLGLELPKIIFFSIVFLQITEFLEITHGEHTL